MTMPRRARATVTTMDLADLEGRTYGPVSWRVVPDAVGDFIDLTGDDPDRWADSAPPGFAAAALFAVAPDLLAELYEHSVIHGEQTFDWSGPLTSGAVFEVSGTVTRVRDRGGVFFVTFEMEARDQEVTVLRGKSLFLAAGQSSAGGVPESEEPEPAQASRGDTGPAQLSASRADLVRYAAATRDWNPVHWDHEAGVTAGFPGVVVHGLLQAGWALRIASAYRSGAAPLSSARIRFRNPLLPAHPVDHTVTPENGTLNVVLLDEEREYLTATMTFSDE